MKTVIVGFGWVGQANALALAIMGQDVYFYDLKNPEKYYSNKYSETYKKIRRIKDVLQVDSKSTTYIVCVGDRVSENGVQDISLIENALNELSQAKGTVVLRSTIIPSKLENLKFDFYLPEFLHEKKAVEECLNPHYFVIGERGYKEPDFFKIWEKNAYKVFRGTPEEASYIKYLSNIWNSLRIAFVNEFGNAIKVPTSKADINSIERVVDFMFGGKSYLRFGKGFGGHCLPKDTRAFRKFMEESNVKPFLIKGVEDSNNLHVNLYNSNGIIKEWFSEWEKPVISGRVALVSLKNAIVKRIFK